MLFDFEPSVVWVSRTELQLQRNGQGRELPLRAFIFFRRPPDHFIIDENGNTALPVRVGKRWQALASVAALDRFFDFLTPCPSFLLKRKS